LKIEKDALLFQFSIFNFQFRDNRSHLQLLDLLIIAAYLVGEDDVCAHAWECAHRSALEAGDGAQ